MPSPPAAAIVPLSIPEAPNCLMAMVKITDDSSGTNTPSGTDRAISAIWVRRTIAGSSLGFCGAVE